MPQVLKSSPDGMIKVAASYSMGQIAVLLAVAHTTAVKLIDRGILRGVRLPTKRRVRRVMHGALILFVKRNPDFRYMLDKLDGYDSREIDFPGATEPPPTTRPIADTGPWSKARPRSVKRGKIPQATSYSANEVAFVLGLARRTVIAKVEAGVIKGWKVPATGLTTWKWRVPHGALVAFVKQNPKFRYALGRIRGCETISTREAKVPALPLPSPAGEIRPRKEPLVAPGTPGWRGHPSETRRGGFKKGAKLPDGRQPSKTREDVAATSEANGKSSADARVSGQDNASGFGEF